MQKECEIWTHKQSFYTKFNMILRPIDQPCGRNAKFQQYFNPVLIEIYRFQLPYPFHV